MATGLQSPTNSPSRDRQLPAAGGVRETPLAPRARFAACCHSAHRRAAILKGGAADRPLVASLVASDSRGSGQAWKHSVNEVAARRLFTFAGEEARITGTRADGRSSSAKTAWASPAPPLGVLSAITPFNFPLNWLRTKLPSVGCGQHRSSSLPEKNAATAVAMAMPRGGLGPAC